MHENFKELNWNKTEILNDWIHVLLSLRFLVVSKLNCYKLQYFNTLPIKLDSKILSSL